MRTTLLIGWIALLLVACDDHDTWSWENDTNGPPANMATRNQCIDITKWPDDNRTASPAYYMKKKKELQERLQHQTPEK